MRKDLSLLHRLRSFSFIALLCGCAEDAPSDSGTTNLTVTEVVRIGSAEGGGPKTFGAVWDVTLDGANRIYALDNQAREIRVFDTAGAHIRTIGRSGPGPGEFGNPIALVWHPNGQLWVVDVGNQRYSVFDTAGTYVRSYTRKLAGYGLPWSGGFDRAGNLYEAAFVQRAGAEKSERVLLRFAVGNEMEAQDTFTVPQREEPYFTVKRPGSEMFMSIPFMPSLQWIFDGENGLFAGGSEQYRIVHQSLTGGDTIGVIERSWTPLAVTDADIERALEGRTDDFDAATASRFRARIPETKPAFELFVLDDMKRLWVMRTATAEETAARRQTFDVFDENGKYVSTTQLDVGWFPPPRVLRGHLVGVTRDDLDVPYVVLYRIGDKAN